MQNFYDLMLYAAGFPFAFYGVSKLGKYAEVLLSGTRNIVLYAAYIYIFLVCLVLFRLMFNYTKWVWPTVELSSPNDASVKQRATWGVIVLGIITSMVWDGIKSLF